MASEMTVTSWRDNKRYLWVLGALVPALPLFSGVFYELSGSPLSWWFGMIVFYGVIPVLDWLIGTDTNNPPEAEVKEISQQPYYRWLVYLAIPAGYTSLIWGAWVFTQYDLAWHELLGLTLSVGVASGIGINTAHELGHKTPELERWLAKIVLAPVAYGHFYIEHNRGHHVRVATPEDPASARFGENFYEFLPRTVIGSLKSAWHLEQERLARHGQGVWSIHNNNLQAWSMTVLLYGAIAAWLGPWVLVFLVGQAVYGFSLLEVVNYLEHYGLMRQRRANGGYERCLPEHSWNSNHTVTNVLLYHLQRHSDHHANPTRYYQALRHFEESPQLPGGYASMIPLAYIPPLWFRIMNPKVVAHYRGDMRRANIKPSIREAVIARYTPQTGHAPAGAG